MFRKIGDELLLSLKIADNWTKDKLHSLLMDTLESMEINQKKYDVYYLKLFGTYDKRIINLTDDEEISCEFCPMNPKYEKFWEYNQFRDEKIPVLVLMSKYIDFKEYGIFAAYYTDKVKDGNTMELWGQKKTWYEKFLEFIKF